MDFKGWAVFCDCDFLWLDDIKKLLDQTDDQYAVMCVQHDYTPTSTVKMNGVPQYQYPRKNWSSMILWNCGHPKNQKLTPELVNMASGQYLHRFAWLDNSDIGAIDKEWNWLINWYHESQNSRPKALHFTEGGPWHELYKDCEYSNLWNEYKNDRLSNQ
jgi:lipopolysaccharide biosynthesis glycosyltransferase